MRAPLLLTVILALVATATVPAQHFIHTTLGPRGYSDGVLAFSAATTQRVDADTERVACKFYTRSTSAITHVDMNLNIGGTVTDTNFTIEVQTDSSDTPSGTPVGTATGAFAGPAAAGFIGAQALGSNTGALTINTPYWIVLQRASGGSLSGTDFIEARQTGATTGRINQGNVRHYNGSDWTTTAATAAECIAVYTHLDSSFSGLAHTASISTGGSGNTDIFGTNRQGVRYKVGAAIIVHGWKVAIQKTGSPSALEIVTYEGNTAEATCSMAAAQIVSNQMFICWNATPPTITAGANLYAVLRQASNGGDDSNDYDPRIYTLNATYIAAMLPTDVRYVFGTGDDPTAWTPNTAAFPVMEPIVSDLAADLSGGAAPQKRVIGGQ